RRLMPRSYDLNPVSITHHPTQRIDTAIGKLPPFDIQQMVDGFLTALKDLTGIDLTGIRDFLENVFGSIDWSDLPTPEAVWGFVVTTFIKTLNIFSIPADVQASINESLGHLQDALEGNYSGSEPIFLAVQALAEAWLKATDPLNAANLFGRISLPQFGSGVPIMALTTAVPNELEPFSAASVPTADGWSFNAGQDAAQVVADGSTKTLYLQSGVIKVEAGQPLDTGVSVTYSGVSSSAGQSIRYVLETFTSDDGSGTATPVTVGSVSNPSGTITTPVLLGNSSWAIPAGVQSVRPALVQDLSAGTVFWKNTPTLKKKLAGQLAGGLPNALDNAGQAIRDAIANALGHSGTGHTSANILTYLQNIPKNVVDGLEDSLGDLQTTLNQIGDIFNNAVVTPINSVVQSVQDWFNQWFGGGSDVAIPLSQKGAPYGVAPLGADGRVSYSFLPDDLVPSDGSDINHFILTLPSDFPVPTATETALSGWTQNGSGDEVSFDDGTNTRWSFPSTAPLGWWDVESAVVWEDSSTGARQSGLTRTLSDTSDLLVRTDAAQAASFGLWTPTNNIESIVDVTNTDALHANDKFQMKVWQDSGSTQDVLADGTYIRAVYRGARLPDVGATVAVQYDNRGAGATNNAPGSLSWTHACSGTDRAAIVYVRFSASALTSLSMSATYGGIPMTLASQSPTITASSRRYIAFAFILMNPPAGSQTVTVTESHSSVTGPEWSANSVSYTGVSGYTASTTGGSGTSYTDTITSATNRRVSEAIFAFGTAGFNTDYSQTSRFAFTSGGLRTLVAGDAAGAPSVAFTTTAPSSIVFRSIAIDLQAAS
ncbi:hypothetical protein, partial [Mycolicibacterium fortuitum]|uniref:hypothetical protein n=1 Tax=Mycolicibacterium fortuitum TaxID=1766 RepID=UPI001C10CB72